MRIAVLDTVYPGFAATLYDRRPELRDAGYEDQRIALLEESFGTSDAYEAGLRALGHEATTFITNVRPLQKAWLRSRGAGRSVHALGHRGGRLGMLLQRGSELMVAAAQVDHWNPDVVLVQDAWAVRKPLLQRWRRQRRFLVAQVGSAHPPLARLQSFDLILTSFRHFVDRFRAAGIDSELFRLAFNHRVIDRLRARGIAATSANPRPYDVTLIGGLDPATYRRLTPVLEAAAARLPLAVWGYDEDRLPGDSVLRRRCSGPAWGLDMYELMAQSKIVVNRHGDIAEGQANNMRLFEATGVGALLLTDRGEMLDEMFDVGHEVAAYGDEHELVDLATQFLANPEQRVAIASAGQARTLADHTYDVRMNEFAALLQTRGVTSQPR